MVNSVLTVNFFTALKYYYFQMTESDTQPVITDRAVFFAAVFLLSLIVPGKDVSGSDSAVLATPGDCVILLHGLARNANSMGKLGEHLSAAGYIVANIDYPSRQYSVEALAPIAINEGVDRCKTDNSDFQSHQVHFVTHSMGGILVRQFLSRNELPNLGRVVMLAPPNNGSEVVDNLHEIPGFEWLNGPAGRQLGTGENSVPNKLGAADFDVGVIAGTRSINVLLSAYLPNPDDGKVSVESARLNGMCDFLTLPVSHPFIMRNNAVIEQVMNYLQQGRFSHADSQLPDDMPSHC